jgi:hypothetical protein
VERAAVIDRRDLLQPPEDLCPLLAWSFRKILKPLDFRDLGGEVLGVFPGQADGADFLGFWLVEAVA